MLGGMTGMSISFTLFIPRCDHVPPHIERCLKSRIAGPKGLPYHSTRSESSS